MGLLEPTIEERMKIFNSLKQATPEGRERRKRLNNAINGTAHEFHGIGVEMNHRYSSSAIVVDDETEPAPEWPSDPILHHRPSTYPGSRLPHAWLNTTIPKVKHTSTLDLAGHGRFTLLTGIGGEGWKEAAKHVTADLGVEIACYSIGWAQDYVDVYRDWETKREVEEDGCVLVRPDRFVCWRAFDSERVQGADCHQRLKTVMRRVLGK